MERLEHEVISEVSRVVTNYNAAIADAQIYDGTGEITLVDTPDNLGEFIDHVLIAMQRQKLVLERAGQPDIAEEVNHCVLQIHDLKTQLD